MKPALIRRFRRRSAPSRSEGTFFKKESQQEQSFFGETSNDVFFQPPAMSMQSIQRKCEECEKEDKKVMRAEDKKEEEKMQRQPEKKEEEKIMKMEDKQEEEKVQKKETATSLTPGKTVSNYISSLNGKGIHLPVQANHFFSSKMGYDFSNVKVHMDKEAAESAKAINAKAYAIGNNIVFNDGQYNTESGEGKKLIAHELVHITQQNKNAVYRKINSRSEEQKSETTPTFSTGDLIYQNTRHFADCNGVTVQGHTDANYGNSYTAPGSSASGSKCVGCSKDDCITNTGKVVSVFTTNPQITLPGVPAGLNECEQKAVQNFINSTLLAHERQHVAAFNTYAGTVKTKYAYKGCADGLDAYTQKIHGGIETARKAAADSKSAALDKNGANIFSIKCKCSDPVPDTGTD